MAGFSASTFALLKKLVEQTMTGAGAIKGQKGDKGDAGTITINSVSTLPAGEKATVENVGTASSAKLNIGIPEGQQGKTGPKGSTGATGQSAYEAAKANGYTGTVTEWLESLHGKDGAAGKAGEDGEAGPAGKSAYEIAKEQGYTGTEAEWIGSLKGKQGDKGETGKDGADGKSFTIQAQYATEAELKAAHPTGNAGDAYYVGENTASSRPDVYIWLAESNEWYNQGPISGVKGDDGASGKSAYELAEENGYSGSESEWLASLKGAKGDKGEKGDQGPQGEQGIQGLQGPQGIAGAKGDKGDTGATGEKGDKGEKGDAATIKVGKVVSGEAGTEAVVANSGTTSDAVFDFTIPRGDKGDKGDTGDNGVIRTTDHNLKDSVVGDIAIHNWTKNILPISEEDTFTSRGVTFTNNKDGSYSATGTAKPDEHPFMPIVEFHPVAGKWYSFSAQTDYPGYMTAFFIDPDGKDFTPDGVYKYPGEEEKVIAINGVFDMDNSIVKKGVSFKLNTVLEGEIVRIQIRVRRSETVNGITFWPVLVESEEIPSYVPYAGYTISACGKNIANTPSNSQTYKGVTIAPSDNGFTLTGTAEDDRIWIAVYDDRKARYVNVADKVGQKMTLSIDNNLKGADYLYAIFIDKDDNKITPWLIAGQGGGTKVKTLTVPDAAVKLSLPSLCLQKGSGTYSGESYHYQLEFGETATEITPYEDLGEITVSNDTSAPVYGLKSCDGVTNVLTEYNAEVEVDYPKTIGGAYSLDASNKLGTVELMHKPNKWDPGKEYDFGDGVYGKRLTGTLTVAKNVESTDKIIFYSGGPVNVISYGGWMDVGDGSRYTVPSTYIYDLPKEGYMGNIYLFYTYVTKQLQLRSLSMVDRTNAPYDVWVLYTKA